MENITGNVTNLWHVTKHIFAPNQDHPTSPPSRCHDFFSFWRLPQPGNSIATKSPYGGDWGMWLISNVRYNCREADSKRRSAIPVSKLPGWYPAIPWPSLWLSPPNQGSNHQPAPSEPPHHSGPWLASPSPHVYSLRYENILPPLSKPFLEDFKRNIHNDVVCR